MFLCKNINLKNCYYIRCVVYITELDTEGKYTNNNFLKVGYRETAKPYNGELKKDPSQTMDKKYIDQWLNNIEAAHRGFEHSNNTYYGYEYNKNINNCNEI